jgi:hypothetical protein
MRCLVQLGFQAILREKQSTITTTTVIDHPMIDEDDTKEELLFEWIKREQSLFDELKSQLIHDHNTVLITNILPLFQSSHSPWELYFEMEEPPIDDLITHSSSTTTHLSTLSSSSSSVVTVKMSWITWFDKLQENIQLFEES